MAPRDPLNSNYMQSFFLRLISSSPKMLDLKFIGYARDVCPQRACTIFVNYPLSTFYFQEGSHLLKSGWRGRKCATWRVIPLFLSSEELKLTVVVWFNCVGFTLCEDFRMDKSWMPFQLFMSWQRIKCSIFHKSQSSALFPVDCRVICTIYNRTDTSKHLNVTIRH